MKEGIQYVEGLLDRPPFNGSGVASYLRKLWRWKAALSHGKMVKVYLGCLPYCQSSSDWRTEPAHQGTFYFDTNSDVHYIHGSFGWVAVRANSDDIQERLVIIEQVDEDIEGVGEDVKGVDEDLTGVDVNMNQETLA